MDGSETVLNQVQEAYDGWGNLIQDWQSVNGVVNASTPSVQYVYDDGATGGVAAYLRLSELVYPNGRVIHYEYNPGADNALSRVSAVADDDGSGGAGQVDAAYTYLGTSTVASEYSDLGAVRTTAPVTATFRSGWTIRQTILPVLTASAG